MSVGQIKCHYLSTMRYEAGLSDGGEKKNCCLEHDLSDIDDANKT